MIRNYEKGNGAFGAGRVRSGTSPGTYPDVEVIFIQWGAGYADSVAGAVDRMVHRGCDLVELIEFLRAHETFRLSPLNLMRILDDAAGIPWTITRAEFGSMFDPDLRPLTSQTEIEARWQAVLHARRT
ncbi:hypothetical protein [Amycolatopsis sp. NPDC001319]|uniref:hypothetical protein n=1 Tax=unclassified Amycolatopsis TaxID=2618356 RepID=UPI0036BD9A48